MSIAQPPVTVPAKGKNLHVDVARSAKLLNLAYKFPTTFPVNTINVRVAVMWLQLLLARLPPCHVRPWQRQGVGTNTSSTMPPVLLLMSLLLLLLVCACCGT